MYRSAPSDSVSDSCFDSSRLPLPGPGAVSDSAHKTPVPTHLPWVSSRKKTNHTLTRQILLRFSHTNGLLLSDFKGEKKFFKKKI